MPEIFDVITRDKLLDPFFTNKFTGRWLGMSAAQGIIRSYNGAILWRAAPVSVQPSGCCFQLQAVTKGTSMIDLMDRKSGIITEPKSVEFV